MGFNGSDLSFEADSMGFRLKFTKKLGDELKNTLVNFTPFYFYFYYPKIYKKRSVSLIKLNKVHLHNRKMSLTQTQPTPNPDPLHRFNLIWISKRAF